MYAEQFDHMTTAETKHLYDMLNKKHNKSAYEDRLLKQVEVVMGEKAKDELLDLFDALDI